MLNYVDELGHNILLVCVKLCTSFNEQTMIRIVELLMEKGIFAFERDLLDWTALEIAYE